MNRVNKIIDDLFHFKIDKKIIDKFNLIVIYTLMFMLMVPRMLSDIHSVIGVEIIYNYIYMIYIIPIIYIFLYNFKNKYIKFSWDYLFLSLFILISIISSFHAFDIGKAFYGDDIRKDGLLTYFMYYLLYVNTKTISNKKDIMTLINIFFIYGFIQLVYCLFQVYGNKSYLFAKSFIHMGYGLCGNPNFYATYTMMFTVIGLLICLFDSKHTKLHVMGTITMFIGLVLSQSSGPFFTLCLLLFSLIVYFIIKKDKLLNKLIIWISIFLSLYVIFEYSSIYVNKHIYNYDYIRKSATISGDIESITEKIIYKVTGDDLFNEQTTGDDVVGTGREDIWKATWAYSLYENHFLLGVGPDNLRLTININHYDRIVDKAHNSYLNIWVTTGVFSLIAYLAWTYVLHREVIKSKNSFASIFLISFICYNIQSILNINVIFVAPYYYIIAGLILSIVDNKLKVN